MLLLTTLRYVALESLKLYEPKFWVLIDSSCTQLMKSPGLSWPRSFWKLPNLLLQRTLLAFCIFITFLRHEQKLEKSPRRSVIFLHMLSFSYTCVWYLNSESKTVSDFDSIQLETTICMSYSTHYLIQIHPIHFLPPPAFFLLHSRTY